ncbi:hypothetical protein COCON_G00089410 [Conger conger]|uniref:Beta-1,4-galactosyltransferase n=1 Tax=Conger conger TaxID=82655 RepID=A0A9Q1DL29_CONCO|nr:hypothetical protein COCON_G00089410 [Conger conger]
MSEPDHAGENDTQHLLLIAAAPSRTGIRESLRAPSRGLRTPLRGCDTETAARKQKAASAAALADFGGKRSGAFVFGQMSVKRAQPGERKAWDLSGLQIGFADARFKFGEGGSASQCMLGEAAAGGAGFAVGSLAAQGRRFISSPYRGCCTPCAPLHLGSPGSGVELDDREGEKGNRLCGGFPTEGDAALKQTAAAPRVTDPRGLPVRLGVNTTVACLSASEQGVVSPAVPPCTTCLPPCLLQRCQCGRSSPLGRLHIEFSSLMTLERVQRENPSVTEGGRYTPPDCRAKQKVAIIIPFRHRDNHLKYWLHYLHPILRRQKIDYGIFIINQREASKMAARYRFMPSSRQLQSCSSE